MGLSSEFAHLELEIETGSALGRRGLVDGDPGLVEVETVGLIIIEIGVRIGVVPARGHEAADVGAFEEGRKGGNRFPLIDLHRRHVIDLALLRGHHGACIGEFGALGLELCLHGFEALLHVLNLAAEIRCCHELRDEQQARRHPRGCPNHGSHCISP